MWWYGGTNLSKSPQTVGNTGFEPYHQARILVEQWWNKVAQKQKGGSHMALYKDYWPKGTFPKQKHRAYKRLEAQKLLKVEHVIYYKDTGAVELWFTTDKELDDIHKLLKESAAKEERA
jgi:hypothetical protein